ncbi:MAG: rhodanese-like domain-containing protein [Bdellovibrionaceae bacterium]|nr:rhodanese-like domain-containing protein [Pseudobdellovibrionaceae bacterium]
MSTPSAESHFDVAAFYAFSKLPEADLKSISQRLQSYAQELSICGLLILGQEGVNSTVAGRREKIEEFLKFVAELIGHEKVEAKWSQAPRAPFRKFAVKIRNEIVTLGKPELVPNLQDPKNRAHRLSPEDWNKTLEEEEDVVVIDTRNWYETELGKFKTAIAPDISEFIEFPRYVENSGIPKDKKVLIYCTGGIRCEKAILEMEQQGYENVYQLEGGILAYLEKFPNRQFEGDCFVFDHRVAVDQNLQPSGRFGLCPHCGQPSTKHIECVRCDTEMLICAHCHDSGDQSLRTCSKNCAHHTRLTPGKKGRAPAPQGLRHGQ